MDVYVQILSMYAKQGFNISGGIFPWHFDRLYPMESIRTYRSLPFMKLTRNQEVMSLGGGINPLEVLVLVAVVRALKPKRIFIVGNSFGWSTLALGLAREDVHVVAIDSIEEGAHGLQGFSLTQKIIQEEGLSNITLLQARSPENISDVVHQYMDGPIDLAFIDGLHTNEQQYIDVQSLQPYMAQDHMIFLHDVLNWDLIKSYTRLRKELPHMKSDILMRTPSGMGVFYSKNISKEVQDIVHAFSEEPWFVRKNQREIADRIRGFISTTKIKIKSKVLTKLKKSIVVIEPQ